MTVGVYGLVAAIVKLDDAGLALTRRSSAAARGLGSGILKAAPLLMKFLGVAGTIAMFLVGGGILVHGIPPLAHFVHELEGQALGFVLPMLMNGLTGVVAGALILGVLSAGKRVVSRPSA
jgi:predicted DNA repair protein MutK